MSSSSGLSKAYLCFKMLQTLLPDIDSTTFLGPTAARTEEQLNDNQLIWEQLSRQQMSGFNQERGELLAAGAHINAVEMAERLYWALQLIDEEDFTTLRADRDGDIRFTISLSSTVGDRLGGFIMRANSDEDDDSDDDANTWYYMLDVPGEEALRQHTSAHLAAEDIRSLLASRERTTKTSK